MFSNYDYDIIIIGGGISGLFLAYKLLNTNLKIIILEGNNDVGGRIQTIKKKDTLFEAGAARFHGNHGKIISLIHDLGLREDIQPLPEIIDYILRGHKNNYPYQTDNNTVPLKDLFKYSITFKEKMSKKELQRISFFQYLLLIYDYETATYIKDAFGYDSEFINLNADAALQMFENDFFNENHYYILKNGLSQLIERMKKEILQSNIILKTNCLVKEIHDDHIITHKGDQFFYQHLICTIPPSSLQKLDFFKNTLTVHSVTANPLLRIYAKYPTKDVWFKNIRRTTTDNYIRQIIPIDIEKGLIMISYTDDKYADLWNAYHTLGDDFLIDALHKEINTLFDITPPKPEFISVHYWKDGFHTWKLGEDSQEVSKNILKPIKGKEVYICGEAYSMNQGWIEGSLDTCYSILSMLPPIKGYDIVKYEFMCKDKEMKEVKEVEKVETVETVEKVEPEDRYFTIDEVLKEDEWIILEVNGFKNIYDVSQWIPHHPGGTSIFQGIEANNHYKNKKLYPDSPTDLFNGVHYHKEENAMEKYLQKKNNYVKLVGRLK